MIFSSFSTSVFDSFGSVKTGLSLSGFSSLGNLAFTEAISAALVAVEGDTYSNVAVLDFGTQKEDLSGDGRGRMPWLSDRYYFGDTSPLTRFVIGLEDALRGFRIDASESLHNDETEAPLRDPWSEDLFHRRPPSGSPKGKTAPADDESDTAVPETDEDIETSEDLKPGEDIESVQSRLDRDCSPSEQVSSDSYWQQYAHDDNHWLVPRTIVSRGESVSDNAAVLLAGVLLSQVSRSDTEQPRERRRSGRATYESPR